MLFPNIHTLTCMQHIQLPAREWSSLESNIRAPMPDHAEFKEFPNKRRCSLLVARRNVTAWPCRENALFRLHRVSEMRFKIIYNTATKWTPVLSIDNAKQCIVDTKTQTHKRNICNVREHTNRICNSIPKLLNNNNKYTKEIICVFNSIDDQS